jgi:hypothetical protein
MIRRFAAATDPLDRRLVTCRPDGASARCARISASIPIVDHGGSCSQPFATGPGTTWGPQPHPEAADRAPRIVTAAGGAATNMPRGLADDHPLGREIPAVWRDPGVVMAMETTVRRRRRRIGWIRATTERFSSGAVYERWMEYVRRRRRIAARLRLNAAVFGLLDAAVARIWAACGTSGDGSGQPAFQFVG